MSPTTSSCRSRALVVLPIALLLISPLVAAAMPERPSGGVCTPGNPVLDGGFEAATAEPGDPLNSPHWGESSSAFGTPLCTIALCGSGGGTAGPSAGSIWSRFGGVGGAAAETATISQSVVFPAGATSINLNFQLWIGAVEAPFTDVLTVKVDGVTQMILDEPGAAEVGYTMRSHSLIGFADGAAHTILFEYVKTAGGNNAIFNVDDISLDVSCGGIAYAPVALSLGSPTTVFRPNSTVDVIPTWRNVGASNISITGSLNNFTGPAGPTYTIEDSVGDYGTIAPITQVPCTGCYSLSVSGSRPLQHWDASVVESIAPPGAMKTWVAHIGDSFSDVLDSSGFYPWVETLFHRGITAGCGPGIYCPLSPTPREQMAVFVLVAKDGVGALPPPCSPPNIFNDVPDTSPYCRFIEELFSRGVVVGCGGDNYCPTQVVTREQMAVFALRTLDPSFTPPDCVPPNRFTDVLETSPFCRFVEELSRRGVVAGCGGGAYCPGDPVTREQMAVFISLTFGLKLYGP